MRLGLYSIGPAAIFSDFRGARFQANTHFTVYSWVTATGESGRDPPRTRRFRCTHVRQKWPYVALARQRSLFFIKQHKHVYRRNIRSGLGSGFMSSALVEIDRLDRNDNSQQIQCKLEHVGIFWFFSKKLRDHATGRTIRGEQPCRMVSMKIPEVPLLTEICKNS